jgi:ABC-2 type transport system ATP-binding protein
METIIQTRALTKIFDKKTIAVNDLTLEVPKNSVYGFLGPNGSGKSTTIKLLLGLIHPSAGSVRVFDTPMKVDSADLRRRIGYLPTQPRFPEDKMTPITYLDYLGKIFGIPKETRIPRITELVRSLDLLALSSSDIKTFSTGETTRLGLAACLINDPELFIMDEPTTGLDPIGRASAVRLISELGSRPDKTLFISSHILGDIERFCTHVGILSNGKLIFNGTISEVKRLIRSNTIELQVEGKIDPFLINLRAIPNIVDVEHNKHIIKIVVNEASNYTTALAEIFTVLAAEELELLSFNSGSEGFEKAFLDLLEEEKSYGFLRGVVKNA